MPLVRRGCSQSPSGASIHRQRPTTAVREGFEHGRPLKSILKKPACRKRKCFSAKSSYISFPLHRVALAGCRAESHARWARLREDPDL